MGERIGKTTEFGGRVMVSVATAAVIALMLGCSSTGQRPTRTADNARPEGAVASAQVKMPAEIRSLELVSSSGAESVELTADRPLVWTSFRDAAGDLVIELPNSVPGRAVRSLDRNQGLIAAVAVESVDDAARPLTRLVVKTREPSEHSLSGDGELLRIELATVGASRMANVEPAATSPPSEVTLAYEPVPEEDLGLVEAAEPESAMASGGARPERSLGTPEAPVAGPPPAGVAASQLFSVDVLSTGDPTVVRIAGDGEFAYSMFQLENPERFVVDLAGVVNTAGSATLPIASTQVDQIRIGQFKPMPGPVSRVVFDLSEAAVPKIERTADGLTVSFSSGTMSAASTPVPEPVTVAEAPVEEIPTETSPESLTFEQVAPEPEPLAPEPVEVAAVQDESMGEMSETSGDASELEVVEVESPVAPPVETYSPPPTPMPSDHGSAAEITIADSSPPPAPVYQPPSAPPVAAGAISHPVGGTSDVALFEAQQVQVDLDPRLEEKERFLESFGTLVIGQQEKQYYGELIDMSLRKADLVETLRSFSTISDLNFVIQPGVAGSVTVELKGVPWDQAMEQILKINNLGMDIDGTIVRIAPVAQLRAEAEEQRRLQQIQQQAVPLRTVLKSLSYSRADEVAALLRNRTGSILSSRGTVQVDNRTNTLILRELPGSIDVVLAVIDNLDSPEPQVTIEARIIEATKSFSRSLGIEWGFQGEGNNELGNTTGLQFPNNYTYDGGVGLLTGGSNGFLNLTLGNILNSFTLDAALTLAESEGLVNLVSAPRVTTLNNNSASIQSGVQIPIQTVSNRTVSVQFVNATLQLTVTPQVTAEGTVMMDITVAKRSPQPGLAIVGSSNSPISTREASTKVIVRDGGTAVIGGIYEVSANQNQDRLPGLANIPILGHLFKNRNRVDSNDELMIFITPRIVQM